MEESERKCYVNFRRYDGFVLGIKLKSKILSTLLAVFLFICTSFCIAEEDSRFGNPCTYFGGSRVSQSEGNLVNCSWFSSNACCKRTEVTSVFGSMYSLYGSTRDCENHMNYLMCYFCSPYQHEFYNGKAQVCSQFCRSVFDHCKSATYRGKALGDRYGDGESFCRGQNFEVVQRENNCFDFDPEVFSCSSSVQVNFFIIILICLSLSDHL